MRIMLRKQAGRREMVKALLTIDDIASKNTVAIVDYLNKNKIPAIMFAWGENIEKHYENAIYALKNGMIVGNHSYSHPAFSKLSFEQAVEEIEKNELVLDKLYKDAGVERRFRPFRFQSLTVLSAMPVFLGAVMTLIRPNLMIPFLTSAAGLLSIVGMLALVVLGWLMIRKIVRIDV